MNFKHLQQTNNKNRFFLKKDIILYVFLTSCLCFSSFAQDSSVSLEPKKFFYPNGQVSSEGFLLNGQPEGYWKTYYETGQLKSEGNRKQFLLDSLWKFYNEEGFLTEEINYVENLKNGIAKSDDQQGVLLSEMPYDSNLVEGERLDYYPNGVVWKKTTYAQGLREGPAFEYDSTDNRIITLLTYKQDYLRSKEEINRKDVQGRKQGIWKTFHENFEVKEECVYKDDILNGICKTFSIKGKLKTIDKFDGGERVENAAEVMVLDTKKTYHEDGSIKTTGGYYEGKKQGIHREYAKDGEVSNTVVYEQDKILGEGIITKSGVYDGPWKHYYTSGELKAEGTYKEGIKIGEWVFYHKNGKIEQKGKYTKKGKLTGRWMWYYKDGSLHREEDYHNGLEEGESVEYDQLGNIIVKGEYVEGMREGPWEYTVGDHIEKGVYQSDERHGEWVFTYAGGKVNFKGEFIDGMPVGKHVTYYVNGQVKEEGEYVGGMKDGEWIKFKENGDVLILSEYENGILRKINGVKLKPEFTSPETIIN